MTTTLIEPGGAAGLAAGAKAEALTKAGQGAWHDSWVVAFGPDVDHLASADPSCRWRAPHTALAVKGMEGSDLRLADDGRFAVLFAGALTNARELQPGATQDDAARIALKMVTARGAEGFSALRGPFAVIAWDRRSGTLLVGRDQGGLEPIFYARAGRGWLLARSPDVLASQPCVSSDPDPVALSEWLLGWFPAVEDTTYRAVKRVPPGSAMTFREGDATVRRYWDPFPEGQPVDWLNEQDLEAFEPVFARAVSRSIGELAPAIFLSGGLDSISVALTATDLAQALGMPPPLALSLVFPDEASTEEPIQVGVAAQLGLEQSLVPFAEAVGPRGLLGEALALSAAYPQPVWNMWAPAYMPLARLAAARGRGVILTGRGGDEWMTISPYLLADQLKRGDFIGAVRLIRMRQRSNSLSGMGNAARLVWRTAGRPLASAALDAIAPATWHRRRRRRLLSERPDWVAPDPAVRRAMDDRIERWIDPARPAGGFYQRESRTALRHPAVTHDLEETQEFGRRHGLRVMHPFWDVDLIELLHRVPPHLLMMDGRAKWMLRRKIGQRLPGLGLERRGKTSAAHVFRGLLQREAPPAWARLGGAPALERMGVVRTADLAQGGQGRGLIERTGGAGRLYTLLNLEAWVQPRV
jgi:asparagine synthase (glutamine-hydrolysing)